MFVVVCVVCGCVFEWLCECVLWFTVMLDDVFVFCVLCSCVCACFEYVCVPCTCGMVVLCFLSV